MRRLVTFAVLVPLAAGCGSGGHTTSVRGVAGSPVQRWIDVEHLPTKAIPGARLFESAGCTVCHTYAGSGTTVLNAPPLTSIGKRHLGVQFQIAHLKCPACVNPGSPMPPSKSLGEARLRALAVFLEASKGTH